MERIPQQDFIFFLDTLMTQVYLNKLKLKNSS